MKLPEKEKLLFLCLLAAATACFAVAFCCIGPSRAPEDAPAVSASDTGLIESLYITSESCQLSEGGQMLLQYEALPESHTEAVLWSSSDGSVVSVSDAGMITALANGEATITAACGACSSSVVINVSGDIVSDTKFAVRQLASDCGGTAYVNAQLLCEKLGRSQSENAPELYELIDSILAYSSGEGDKDRLYAAIKASGLNSTTCLTAAEACSAKHEMLSCEAVISFVGDVTLARYNESNAKDRFPSVYAASGSKTYPFDRVKSIFSCDSMTVANFEGTLTGSRKHLSKSFYFRGDPLYAAILPACGIDAVTLANNHAGDYLDAGFDDTVKYLSNAGVSSFYSEFPLTKEINGGSGKIKTVMLGAVCVGDKFDSHVLNGILSDIRRLKISDNIVVVNVHWGVEGHTVPEKSQQDAAHAMIDAGADLVVGHHPHVMQGIECYNGRYIAYSLGNFCFGGNASVSSSETVILRAQLGREGGGLTVTGISVVPCRTTSSGTARNDYQPKLCFGSDGDAVTAELIRRSGSLKYGIKTVSRSGI